MSRKYRVGLVGWRGMVGSVLMDRMRAEKDFDLFDPVFFSTSNAGGKAPMGDAPLGDAHDIKALSALDAIVTCQGGDYTLDVHPKLRSRLEGLLDRCGVVAADGRKGRDRVGSGQPSCH